MHPDAYYSAYPYLYSVAATKRIRGEKPALRADVQEPPKKKRKVTKVATRNVRQKKAAKNVPKDMVDDPEKLVRKERWVWEPSEQPARRSPSCTSYPYLHVPALESLTRCR